MLSDVIFSKLNKACTIQYSTVFENMGIKDDFSGQMLIFQNLKDGRILIFLNIEKKEVIPVIFEILIQP